MKVTDDPARSLLPDGLRDVLPPDAEHEAETLATLLACFRLYGYRRVDPPLMEFEQSLFDGAGAATALHTFRLMDPLTHHMMGIRADMTGQVIRIAATRLREDSLPLRLCYAGPVLRVHSTQLRPERQLTQIGCELIGSDAAAGDVEVIGLAAEALWSVGVNHLSVDISLPTLISALFDDFALAETTRMALRAALNRKDARAVDDLCHHDPHIASVRNGTHVFSRLLAAAGPAPKTLNILSSLALPPVASCERDRLIEVVEKLHSNFPALAVTIDPVEHRGFEYQKGLSFTFFSRDVRGELGRGGRYFVDQSQHGKEGILTATGFSLYMDTLMRAVPAAFSHKVIYACYGADSEKISTLRKKGEIVIQAFGISGDDGADALEKGCGYILRKGSKQVEKLG